MMKRFNKSPLLACAALALPLLAAAAHPIQDSYRAQAKLDNPAFKDFSVAAGASAALQLACLALIDAGDEVLMPDPSYPCNRHFVSAADGRAVLILPPLRNAFSSAPTRCKRPGGPRHAACCWHRPPTPRAVRLTRTSCAASTPQSKRVAA